MTSLHKRVVEALEDVGPHMDPERFRALAAELKDHAIVPREPTEKMSRAGFLVNTWRNPRPCGDHCIGRITMPADAAYRAMIEECEK